MGKMKLQDALAVVALYVGDNTRFFSLSPEDRLLVERAYGIVKQHAAVTIKSARKKAKE